MLNRLEDGVFSRGRVIGVALDHQFRREYLPFDHGLRLQGRDDGRGQCVCVFAVKCKENLSKAGKVNGG